MSFLCWFSNFAVVLNFQNHGWAICTKFKKKIAILVLIVPNLCLLIKYLCYHPEVNSKTCVTREICLLTVWKFQDFCITQILREISFEDSKSAKSAILTHLEALNFNFHDFLYFLKAAIYQMNKFTALKMAKLAGFAILKSSKLISRKIWVIQKSWNFHTVG